MAMDWSKLNFFSRLDARARIFVLLGGLAGTILVIYLVVRIFFGGGATTGATTVANVPQGMTSVPGSTLSPEYARSLEQARNLAAQQAQMTGTSAIPTLIRTADQTQTPNCIICSDQMASVNYDLDDWVKQGKISPDVASHLEQLAASNVPVSEYAAELDRLVREGKLTPEQARRLLEQYKRQHANALVAESAKAMDAMIKSGELPLDVANHLLQMQRDGVSPADYAAELDRLVREGKISPATAAKLLAQYTQQCMAQAIRENNTFVQAAAGRGEITADVAKQLIDLSTNNAPVDSYNKALKQNIDQGKLTPAAAARLLDTYTKHKTACGRTTAINQMIQQAEAAAYKELNDLLAAGKITKEVATQLAGLIRGNVPLADFQAVVNQLVTQGKLTPDIAKLKIGDYTKVKNLREQAARLANLQANNASPEAYAEELKRAVQAGILTPDEAARLLQEYQSGAAQAAPGGVVTGTSPADQQLAALQAQVRAGAAQAPQAAAGQFTAAQAQAALESEQDRQNRIQGIISAMSGQANQLVSAWQPPQMAHREGSGGAFGGGGKGAGAAGAGAGRGGAAGTGTGKGMLEPAQPVMIKGGSILFAVLDTAINSDYPDSPVMATVVDGKYQGARLMGKIVTTKGVSGQMDRVSLNFTLMNMEEWPKSKSITAYAIDPDTARTVMASSVDYHYMQRFGAMFATSFLQGYATAIMTSGSTTTTGIFGTSSVHPELSPQQKIAVALGQVGQTLGQATANYINRPPTVRVDSGVGLGILFMSDVTE